MKRAITWFFRTVTGKTEDELARVWTWHHFATRSRIEAYWLTLIS